MGKIFKMLILLTLLYLFFQQNNVNASPPPEEIEKTKEMSPYHVIGVVTNDSLSQDTTTNKDHPTQLRKMSLQIQKIIKADNTIQIHDDIDIYYSYIPTWDLQSYAGGSTLSIMKGDTIEIWLKKNDKNQFEPSLGGYTYKPITLEPKRVEPVPEPKVKIVRRSLNEIYVQHSHIIAFLILIFTFTFAAIFYKKYFRK